MFLNARKGESSTQYDCSRFISVTTQEWYEEIFYEKANYERKRHKGA